MSTPNPLLHPKKHSSSSKAHRIGSLLFCPSCGTLLDLPGDKDEIACEQCGRKEPASCESKVSHALRRVF